MTTTDGPPHLTAIPGGHTTPPPPPPGDNRGGAATYNLPAERALLGHILTTPTLAPDLLTQITPDAFYDPRHETLWHLITHLVATDHTPDHLTLVHELTAKPARGVDHTYLLDLREAATYTPDPHVAVHLVRETARRRHADQALHSAQLRLRNTDDVQAALETAMDALEHGITSPWHTPGTITPTTWSPVDLTPVLKGEHLDPPPTMLARSDGQPLLYDGAVHTISGESESGKTWLTLLAVLQLLQAGDDALFIDFEDRADRVIARLLALGATPDQIRAHFAYVRPDRPLDDDGRHQLTPHLTGRRLVILDGVTEAMTMHGLDLNSNADSATFQGLLPRWIADHGPAVVLIDHVVKDKEQQGRFAIGAQHKLAGIDGAAYLVKVQMPFSRGKRGVARVEVGKDRPGHVREFAHGKTVAEFTLDATGGDNILIAHLTPIEATNRTGDAFEPSYLMEKISRYVQANPGMSKKSILDVLNGKTDTKRLALELLVTRGYIGTKAGQRGAVQHFHERPYYADPDQDPDTETTPEDTP